MDVKKITQSLQKIPLYITLPLLAVTFCFQSYFPGISFFSRFSLGLPLLGAAIIYGLISWGLFELCVYGLFYFVKKTYNNYLEIHINQPSMVNVLRYFVVAKNILIGLLRLLYIVNPALRGLFEYVIVILISFAFYILYFFVIRKVYLTANNYARAIFAFGIPFAVIVIFLTGGIV